MITSERANVVLSLVASEGSDDDIIAVFTAFLMMMMDHEDFAAIINHESDIATRELNSLLAFSNAVKNCDKAGVAIHPAIKAVYGLRPTQPDLFNPKGEKG